MEVTFCDRCEKEIPRIYKKFDRPLYRIATDDTTIYVCANCYNSFVDFYNGVPVKGIIILNSRKEK